MKEKLKILISLVCVSVGVSCGGHKTNTIRLNRETYKNKIGTVSSFVAAVSDLKDAQFQEGNSLISSKGTIKTNYAVDLTADKFTLLLKRTDDSEVFHEYENTSELSQSKISWDIDKNYLKIDNQIDGIHYIIVDDKNQWWDCFTTEENAKCRINVTDDVDACRNFKNYVFNTTTQKLTSDYTDSKTQEKSRIGFDLSGFIGPYITGDIEEDYELHLGQNVISPVDFLNLPMCVFDEKLFEFTFANFLDIQSLKLDAIGIDIGHYFAASKNLSKNAYCMDIGTGLLHLSDIEELYKSGSLRDILLTLFPDFPVGLKLNDSVGDLNFDSFINYKNNFIHQEEIILDLKDVSLNFLIKLTHETRLFKSLDCDIKNANLSFTINQEYTETCSVIDTINLDEYTPLQVAK